MEGFDQRPIKENKIKIQKLKINFKKKEILDKLTNNDISMCDKIKIIKQYDLLNDSIVPNITSGGLFDDFDK
jgi:hypothetical protein